jgi:hypothetical protein
VTITHVPRSVCIYNSVAGSDYVSMFYVFASAMQYGLLVMIFLVT